MVCLNPLFMCLSLACDQDWIFYLQMIRMRPDCTRMHQIVFSFFLLHQICIFLHQICIFLQQIHQFLLAVTNFWRWIAARTSKQLFLISNQLSLTFRPHRTFACFLITNTNLTTNFTFCVCICDYQLLIFAYFLSVFPHYSLSLSLSLNSFVKQRITSKFNLSVWRCLLRFCG